MVRDIEILVNSEFFCTYMHVQHSSCNLGKYQFCFVSIINARKMQDFGVRPFRF
jgi:hypothetical protein